MILAQLAPDGTSVVELYSPPEGQVVDLVMLWVCNVTTSAAQWSLYLDPAGAGWSDATALVVDAELPPLTARPLHLEGLSLDAATASLGVAVGTADAITFTLAGRRGRVSP